MAKSVVLKQNQGFLSTLPIGVIIAWHRDLDPTKIYIPSLPSGWAECNGQVLNDTESPFHGQVIPNLNAEGRFLRGAAMSGIFQSDEFKGHSHTMGTGGADSFQMAAGGATQRLSHFIPDTYNAGGPKSTNAAGGNETRPTNMSVVWIMKVKQIVSAKATPAVQADPNTSPGTVYINQAGNVGIGTGTPTQKLSVAGVIESTNGGLKFPDGTIQTTASQPASRTVTSELLPTKLVFNDYTLAEDDGIIFAMASSNSITIKLPPSSSSTIGRSYYIYKVSTEVVNSVTIEASGLLPSTPGYATTKIPYTVFKVVGGYAPPYWILSKQVLG